MRSDSNKLKVVGNLPSAEDAHQFEFGSYFDRYFFWAKP